MDHYPGWSLFSHTRIDLELSFQFFFFISPSAAFGDCSFDSSGDRSPLAGTVEQPQATTYRIYIGLHLQNIIKTIAWGYENLQHWKSCGMAPKILWKWNQNPRSNQYGESTCHQWLGSQNGPMHWVILKVGLHVAANVTVFVDGKFDLFDVTCEPYDCTELIFKQYK